MYFVLVVGSIIEQHCLFLFKDRKHIIVVVRCLSRCVFVCFVFVVVTLPGVVP